MAEPDGRPLHIHLNPAARSDTEVAEEAASLLTGVYVTISQNSTARYRIENSREDISECDHHIIVCGEQSWGKTLRAKVKELVHVRGVNMPKRNATIGAWNPRDCGIYSPQFEFEHSPKVLPENLVSFVNRGIQAEEIVK